MKSRKEGKSQVTAAAVTGISERTGRNIEKGKRSEPKKKSRLVSRRSDPLADVWASELVPMLEALPQLQPMTLLEYLQETHTTADGSPVYQDSILRTLQRRIKAWKAESGPKKEVMFRQQKIPGRLGLSDFTHPKDFVITINGKPLKYILYHFRLAYSHWSYMKVILGGESFTALSEGLQEALWRLGGAPKEHRTDSLSAAFKNLTKQEGQDCSEGYQMLCEHYGIKPTRNNLGAKHENGSIESPHGHLKRRIKQALLLRGSHDFKSVAEYQAWLETVVNQHNRRYAKALSIEQPVLSPLPLAKTTDYTEVVSKVTSSSTINVRRVTYTVPSQLQGETLKVRLYHDRLIAYLGSRQIVTLERVYPAGKTTRARQVDYRHVIHSLVKKPQAFRHSVLRDDLLPTLGFQKIWQHANETMEARQACRFILGLLYLAAKQDCEKAIEEAALSAISQERLLRLEDFQRQFDAKAPAIQDVTIHRPMLASYDVVTTTQQQEVSHVQ